MVTAPNCRSHFGRPMRELLPPARIMAEYFVPLLIAQLFLAQNHHMRGLQFTRRVHRREVVKSYFFIGANRREVVLRRIDDTYGRSRRIKYDLAKEPTNYAGAEATIGVSAV